MANEIGFSGPGSGRTVYVLIRNRTNQVWNGSAFVTYAAADYATYVVQATEQDTGSNYYAATFPAAIVAGVYGITAKAQAGGSPAATDSTCAVGDQQWNGSATLPLSDLATSGQFGLLAPIRVARGTMVQNFKFYMRSAADRTTPFVSGVVSGQIKRDSDANWSALQSGAFVEEGYGFYRLQALTSGDILCNTASLLFTANGVSGGAAVPVPFTLVCQRTSGQ